MARTAPERKAIVCKHRPDAAGRTALTFKQLNLESDCFARGLSQLGLKAGSRALLMVRPGLEFISLTFALFKLGAVPILIDPGMGKKNLFDCIKQAQPEALIAIPRAHLARVLSSHEAFKSIRINVTVGRRWFWGGESLQQVRALGATAENPVLARTTHETTAAILFTTGSTGIPKGVLYTHGMFGAQVVAIQRQYQIKSGEVDLAAFPLFALFSAALGTTCVIPDMDPTRPAECKPEKIVKALQDHEVTYSFGSPAIWKRVGPYCLSRGIKLPALKRILMAGAPVRGEVLAPFAKILSADADTYIPYGATEALPVASIRGSEVLQETWALTRRGGGHCVGKPLPGISLQIVRPDSAQRSLGDKMIWDDNLVLPPGEIGEIAVKGNVVTREYFKMPEATRNAKIYEKSEDGFWHLMGDMGYVDENGRLWFCGRKAHRVLKRDCTLYSVCVEAVFEAAIERIFGAVRRVALVGIGKPGEQSAVILCEQGSELSRPGKLRDEFNAWRKGEELAAQVERVLSYPAQFPVDIRHNAKINREELSRWAARVL